MERQSHLSFLLLLQCMYFNSSTRGILTWAFKENSLIPESRTACPVNCAAHLSMTWCTLILYCCLTNSCKLVWLMPAHTYHRNSHSRGQEFRWASLDTLLRVSQVSAPGLKLIRGREGLHALLCCGQDSSPGLLDRGPRSFTGCRLKLGLSPWHFPSVPIRSQLWANLQPQLHFHPPFPPTPSPSPLDLGKYKSKHAKLGHAAFNPRLLCSEQRQDQWGHQGSHRCSLSTLVTPACFSSLLHG